MIKLFTFFIMMVSSTGLSAEPKSGSPMIRIRLGMNMLNFTVGENYTQEALGALMTFNPTVLWSLPSFRARMGLHYVGDFGSQFGAIPISGIGISSYFYPFGLSSAYEISSDGTLFQKSKPSPHVFGKLTPVNFNINASKEQSPSGAPISFSAYMIEGTLVEGMTIR
ncbi:MAG: hypothetical protein HC902_08170 [Calothrix sp. SM1_5_4]|nr:hypothetical protein [Calothrix sp. SM1_5_4]